MSTAELCDRVVPVLVEYTVVQALRPLQVDDRVDAVETMCDGFDTGIGVGKELVEEEAAHRFGGSAVAGE